MHRMQATLDLLFGPVADDLRDAADVFRAELDTDQSAVRELSEYIERYHGKQLRPALLLLVACANGRVSADHHTLAAVVEMVHIATLVHDDVLDEGNIRRQAETVNRRWGNEQAVLLGDLLFSHAYHLCSSLADQFAARLIGRTAVLLCEGELMQNANRGNFALVEETYFEIIRRKTAVLTGICAQLGARYAGAPGELEQRMYAFGERIGIAFQIVDDLLDIRGSEDVVGKSLGRDIEKGKLTLPLIHFLATQARARRDEMRELLANDSVDRIARIAALLHASDSIAYTENRAHEQIQAALAELEHLPESDARASLRALAEFVLARRY